MKPLRILAAAALLTVAATASALRVDYDSIRSVVNDRPELFRQLTARFIDADTTLTDDELAVVYYGHAMIPGYNPEETYADVMKAFDDGDLATTLVLADEALRRNPVSLPMLFKCYGICAISELDRLKDRCPALAARINMLCRVIEESGQGVIMYSPFCVISPADIDEFLTKCWQVQRVYESADMGDLRAVKVHIDGIDDDVILYFDLLLAKKK